MDKIYLNSEDYENVVNAYKEKHGYDGMSDEEKDVFDERLSKVVEESDDSDNETSESYETEQYKDSIRDKYGYENMSEEQKNQFDERLDQFLTEQQVEHEEPEKVLRRIR